MHIIDSFSKLSLGAYAEIQAVAKDESLEELDRHIRILSILTGSSEEDILHLTIPEFTELSAKAKFLTAEGFKARPIAKKYIIGDYTLFPVTDYRKLETCQYIDWQTFAGDLDNHIVELVSVLLVPKGHRYNDGYDILDVQRVIREQMSVADGVAIVGFFLTLCGRSIRDMLSYSRAEAEGLPEGRRKKEILARIRMEETRLRTSGVG